MLRANEFTARTRQQCIKQWAFKDNFGEYSRRHSWQSDRELRDFFANAGGGTHVHFFRSCENTLVPFSLCAMMQVHELKQKRPCFSQILISVPSATLTRINMTAIVRSIAELCKHDQLMVRSRGPSPVKVWSVGMAHCKLKKKEQNLFLPPV